MGTGTYSDPYVVTSWAEFESYNTADYAGDYVAFYRDIDFSLIYPNGCRDGLVIYPNIIGNDQHWLKLCVLGRNPTVTAIDFRGTVENLYIDGMYANAIESLIAPRGEITGLHLTAQIDNNGVTQIFGGVLVRPAFTSTISFVDSELDIRVRTRGNIHFQTRSTESVMKLKNTSVNIDFECSEENMPHYINNIEMDASMFTGVIKSSGDVTLQICQKSPYEYTQSLWDVKVEAPRVYCESVYGNDDCCYYNTDKTTFYGDTLDWIGLTTEQLADETELEDAGFPIGGDSPWKLSAGKIKNNAWTSYRNEKLGAFNNCTQFDTIYVPNDLKSIGRYAFNITQMSKIKLPDDCTYYSTSFKSGMEVEGGILIE